MKNRERLEDEFSNKHQGVAFQIISPKNDVEMRQKALSEIIERELNIDSNIFGCENILDIKFGDFDAHDFVIDSVEKGADDEFVVKVCVDTKKYIAKPEDGEKNSDEVLAFRLKMTIKKTRNGIFTIEDCSEPIGMHSHPDYSICSLSESLLRLNNFTRIFYETAIENEMLSSQRIARSLTESIIENEKQSIRQIMCDISEGIYLSSAEAVNQSLNTNLSSIAGLALNDVTAGDSSYDDNSKNRKNENNGDKEKARGGKEACENGY